MNTSAKVLLRNVRATLYVDNEPVREEFSGSDFPTAASRGAVALRMSRDAVDAPDRREARESWSST